jgi:hypothetical protein
MNYIVIITMLTDKYAPRILEELIKNGYKVSAVSTDNILFCKMFDDEISHVMGIRCEHKNTIITVNSFREFFVKILQDLKYQYYSLVVIDGCSAASWNGGNIRFQEDDKIKSPFKPRIVK